MTTPRARSRPNHTPPVAVDGLAGVDEAGRGPLAGAVFAAAVILDPARPIAGLADSKQLTARRREALAQSIREYSQAWAIAFATVEEIDRLNILQASLLAMKRAVDALAVPASEICVDGLHVPAVACPARALVEGDRLVPAISAASILAKVARDAEMLDWDVRYPAYGFARHKGYGTAEHLAALREHGPCPIHRTSFAPVRAALAQQKLSF
ncbi:MAG: ribonuclease HII [Burkholderiales bacterium]|nr:ribonuclease HII [Burkholderiales bacterium]